MEITTRALWTMIHGMGFGALYLLACSGALVELYRFTTSTIPAEPTPGQERFLKVYLAAMVVIAWVAVLMGAYVIYPWYRAVAPAGADLSLYPKFLLTSHASTAGWHNFGMEWKEHVAWIAPMTSTMVVWVLLKHRAEWNAHRAVRSTVLDLPQWHFLQPRSPEAGEP